MKLLKLVPEETNFNFIRLRGAAFAISLIMILGSLGLLVTKGLNLGIDFTGGTLIEIQVKEKPDLADLRSDLNALGVGSVSIQEFGSPNDLLIRLGQQTGDEVAQKAAIEKVRAAIDANYASEEVDYRRVEYVGPQVGDELKKAGLLAFLLSMLGILVYIWIRFEWQFGVAAVIALFHDTIGVLGFFALSNESFDLATLAAVLLVAGYSINDTVVVFDRVRENMRKYKKMALGDLLNLSVNQMLSRTIMTSLTTVLVLVMLYVFGGEVIKGFTEALIFGIIIGTYSSIYVAAPLLMLLKVRQGKTADDEATA